MLIHLLTISDSDKHFAEAIKEYQKRLGKSLRIENIKPSRKLSLSETIQEDTLHIINALKKFGSAKKILLSKNGQLLDTLEFAKFCRGGSHLIFIIGGPYGLDEDFLKPHVDLALSFGKMTFAHGLAKLVLLEQIYRITTLEQGKNYHH